VRKTVDVPIIVPIISPPEDKVVDHKNRNKLDNTRGNLRICTHSENAHNRTKQRGLSSLFLGVCYLKGQDKFHAYVFHRGKHLRCGDFADEIEAARAHDAKAVEVYGEFARLNFPDEWTPERRAEVYGQREVEKGEGKKAEDQDKRPRAKTQGRREASQAKKVRRSEGRKAKSKSGSKGATIRKVAGREMRRAGCVERKSEAKKPASDKTRATKSKRATGHKSRATAPKGHKVRRPR